MKSYRTFANIPMRKKNIIYWLPIKAIRLYWKWLPARQSMVSTPLQFSSTLPAMPTVTYITTDIMLNAVLHSWNGMWKDSVWPATTVKATSYSNRKAIFIWRWQTTESNICRFLSASGALITRKAMTLHSLINYRYQIL